ncbi:MAG: formimidoylglutamase [Chitinophagales bacterium]
MIADFLTPVSLEEIQEKNKTWLTTQLGAQVTFNTTNQFEDTDYQIAILGIEEDRTSTGNHGCGKGIAHIKRELYKLHSHFTMPKIIDLGTIKNGHHVKDTQTALVTLLKDLLDKRIVTIIIGGGHDMTYGQFLAYQDRIHPIDLTVIDEKIDIEETDEIQSSSFLWHLLNHEGNSLFSCTHLAHQLFYTNPKHLDMIESLGYDAIRLGEIKADIFEMEPVLRNADFVSFDLSAVKSADAPANAVTSPNGLTGEEACQLSRFAGFSNKTSSFGLYEMNPYFDQNNQGAKQSAQMLWYFIEGFAGRKVDDYPSENNKEFTKYLVKMELSDYELIFWKSHYSERWWMEIPQKDMPHGKIIPCSYTDYKNAMKDELPDKWMKVYGKLN